MMSSPTAGVKFGRPAELGGDHDERTVEQPLLIEIQNEGSESLVEGSPDLVESAAEIAATPGRGPHLANSVEQLVQATAAVRSACAASWRSQRRLGGSRLHVACLRVL